MIGLNDSGGARIQEGVVSLAGYADIFQVIHFLFYVNVNKLYLFFITICYYLVCVLHNYVTCSTFSCKIYLL